MVEGDLDLSAKTGLLLSGNSRVDIAGNNIYGHAINQLKLVGAGGGMIGGPFMRFTGQTYSGAKDADDADDFETAIFHGTFKGTADKALHSQKANTSVSALIATHSTRSDHAVAATALERTTSWSSISNTNSSECGNRHFSSFRYVIIFPSRNRRRTYYCRGT